MEKGDLVLLVLAAVAIYYIMKEEEDSPISLPMGNICYHCAEPVQPQTRPYNDKRHRSFAKLKDYHDPCTLDSSSSDDDNDVTKHYYHHRPGSLPGGL